MDDRTRAWLRERFRAYYDAVDVERPPDGSAREWAWIPWDDGGAGMVRHRSMLDVGAVPTFLAREAPRHVYASAALYDDAGAQDMGAKGYRGADLVFDLDADHLPGVDPDADGYAEQLARCKDALLALLDLLEADLGYDDVDVVFSGRRGYHVHVRSERARQLDRDARRAIVEYVTAAGVDVETVVETERVAAPAGRATPAPKRTLDGTGGWSRRVLDRLRWLVDTAGDLDGHGTRELLRSHDGVGDGRAAALARAFDEHGQAIREGNVDVHGAMRPLLAAVAEEVVREEAAPIDEPVTTDTHRLMRVPGSLHGGSGLVACRVERDALADFDPLVDAVPEPFRGGVVDVEVTDPDGADVAVCATPEARHLEPGTVHRLPEHRAVQLMARGDARKAAE